MYEALSESIPEPGEVSSGIPVGSGIGLHLKGEEVAPAEFGHDVHLVATMLLPEVVKAGTRLTDGELGPQLSNNERVEKAPEHVAVSEHRSQVEPQH